MRITGNVQLAATMTFRPIGSCSASEWFIHHICEVAPGDVSSDRPVLAGTCAHRDRQAVRNATCTRDKDNITPRGNPRHQLSHVVLYPSNLGHQRPSIPSRLICPELALVCYERAAFAKVVWVARNHQPICPQGPLESLGAA